MKPTDPLTIIAAAVLAATLAAVCHEALGHGLACEAVGGHILLLTSIWFRCSIGASIVDAGGAIASLAVGVVALAVLSTRTGGPALRFMLLLLGGISLLWFAGQLILHPILDRDDWAVIARREAWPAAWRPMMVAAGIATYAATMHWTKVALRRSGTFDRPTVRLGYVAAAVSAVLAGLAWQPEQVASAREGLLTLGVAPLGLLFAASRTRSNSDSRPVSRSWSWIAASLLVFGAFLLIQARGLGSLANSRLPDGWLLPAAAYNPEPAWAMSFGGRPMIGEADREGLCGNDRFTGGKLAARGRAQSFP